MTEKIENYQVTTLNDNGYGSFRYGLLHAKLITFVVCGTIVLTENLPKIDHYVKIEANEQIKLNCNEHEGLAFVKGSAGSELSQLYMYGAKNNGINIIETKKIKITNCQVLNNVNSISINNSKGNTLTNNILSGNSKSGLILIDSSFNTIVRQYIGVNSNGDDAVPNGEHGIYMYNSNNNIIGGTSYGTNNPTGSKGTTEPTFVVPFDGNLVSGNKGHGIFMT